MRCTRSLIVTTLLALCGTGVAQAQSPDTLPRERRQRDRWVSFNFSARLDVSNDPLEIDGLRSSGGTGVDDPDTGNSEIKYEVKHAFIGAVIGARLTPPTLRNLELEFDLIIGTMSTELGMDAEEASALVGAAGTNNEQQADDDLELAYGAQLRLGYLFFGQAYVGFDYQFMNGEANFSNELFYNKVIDGDYAFVSHRLNMLLGIQIAIARPYLGVGLSLYEATADIDENAAANPDRWKIDFVPDDTFRAFAGVELAEAWLFARGELNVYPLIGLSLQFGIRI